MRCAKTLLAGVLLLSWAGFAAAASFDEDAATHLMKKSKCFKCHSVDKKKEGPSFHKTAGELKGKADAEQKLYVHLTTHPKVKVDGKEQEHASLKTKDEAEIRNVIRYILAQ